MIFVVFFRMMTFVSFHLFIVVSSQRDMITINSLVAQCCQCLRQRQQRRTEEEISVRVDNQRHQTSSCYFTSHTDHDDCLSSPSLCPTVLSVPIPFIVQTFITCPDQCPLSSAPELGSQYFFQQLEIFFLNPVFYSNIYKI